MIKFETSQTTINNDDAVVDCAVYANEVRMCKSPAGIISQRRVCDVDTSGKTCSISMCGNDDDPECRMLKYCPNGHFIHDKCLEFLFQASETLSTIACPQCRSNNVTALITEKIPIPICHIIKMFSDSAIVSNAIKSTLPDPLGIEMLYVRLEQDELNRIKH